MARFAVAVATVLLHTLLGMVCAMPGPGAPGRGPSGGPRLQCPGCSKGFKTHRAVRIHQNAVGPPCSLASREPKASGWSGSGPSAAGRVEDLSGQRVRLPGLDSNSDSGRSSSSSRIEQDHRGGVQAAGQEEPAAEPEEPAPTDLAEPLPLVTIHAYTYTTYIYIHILTLHTIHSITYNYIQIHIDTY